MAFTLAQVRQATLDGKRGAQHIGHQVDGAIEIVARRVEVLNTCAPLPFQLDHAESKVVIADREFAPVMAEALAIAEIALEADVWSWRGWIIDSDLPPVPTAQVKPSTLPSVWRQISGPVLS